MNLHTLNDEQRREIPAMLMVGLSRARAADYIGCTPEELYEFSQIDETFAAALRRAEATAELAHLRAVHEACKDPKNWRASLWMLERRYPDRYGKRPPNVVTHEQLNDIIKQMAEIILEETPDDEQREKILRRVELLVASRQDELP